MAVIHWDRPAEAGRPSCGHCRSLTDLAGSEASERHAEAIAFAERAIELVQHARPPRAGAGAGLRGGARFALGDAGGLDDTRRALEAALGQGRETAVLYGNLAEDLGRAGGPRARLEVARLGAAFTQRRGIAEWVQPLSGLGTRALADLGRIDEARALTAKLLSDADTAEDRMYQLYLCAADVRLSARRGPESPPRGARDLRQPWAPPPPHRNRQVPGPGDRADRIADPSPSGATTPGGWHFMTMPHARRHEGTPHRVLYGAPDCPRWMRVNPGGCLHAGARGTAPARRTGRTGWPLPPPPGTR